MQKQQFNTISLFQYQLDHLKSLCEHSLTSNLEVESVCSTLLLADMHHATLLKSKCIDFVVANSSKVIPTEAYQNLLKTRVELVAELFQAISIKASPFLESK